jgi:sulfite dehydrogenase
MCALFTNLADGTKVKARTETLVKGIAFDGGYGVTDVLLSSDAGQTWRAAKLGPDLGRHSFREWQTMVRLPAGKHELKVRAINRIGQSQPMAPLWNSAGYMRNVVEAVRVQAG